MLYCFLYSAIVSTGGVSDACVLDYVFSVVPGVNDLVLHS